MECEECEDAKAIWHYCSSCRRKVKREDNWLIFWITLLLGWFVLMVILLIAGTLDSGIEKFDIDKDKIASDYVKSYYPEFEDCVVEYDPCIKQGFLEICPSGVEVYCNELTTRDSMKSLKGEPTKTIIFEKGLTIDKIFEMRLIEEGLR